MARVEMERTLVKSPPELWSEIGTQEALGRWLGDIQVRAADAPGRLEWAARDSTGVIELEASGWGTRVRAFADPKGLPWDRVNTGRELERCLGELMDHLGASSLQRG